MNKTVKSELVIPITSSAFEKRLAELVWENCPELARQMVAGKIALSLEVDNETIHGLIQGDLHNAVSKFAEDNREAIRSAVKLQVKEYLEKDAFLQISERVKVAINKIPIANEIGKLIVNAVRDECAIVINSWLMGENKETMTKLIENRVDSFIQHEQGWKVDGWLESESKANMAKLVLDRIDAYLKKILDEKQVRIAASDAEESRNTGGE